MKRFPLMVASAAIGVALLAGVARELIAEESGPVPPAGGSCYYYWYTCSYPDNGGYWSDCTPGGSPGMIPTDMARIVCVTYNNGQ